MRRLFRRIGRRLSAVSLAVALAAMVVGAAGCDTYHYYDMDLIFGSGWVGGINSAGAAQQCIVTVSGADSHEFPVSNCGIVSQSNYPDTGTFEFATFADSGTLTFAVDAYNGTPYTTACLFGTGSTTIPATSTVTTKGSITIDPMGAGCANQ
jgi:hypothetical protein